MENYTRVIVRTPCVGLGFWVYVIVGLGDFRRIRIPNLNWYQKDSTYNSQNKTGKGLGLGVMV